MLRVHTHGFARGDAKEERVELVHGIDQGRRSGIHLAGPGPLRVIKLIDCPAVGGDFAHEIQPIAE